MRKAHLIGLGLALGLAQPATADVKDGVDAWQRGDYAAAIKEWRPLAIAGDADAQFNLAQAYKLGRGLPADLKQAEMWYKKAADKGHVQAADNYGLVLFQNGDRKGAVPWLEKSAARGEPRAQYVLGTALFNGDIASKDWVRAYALMTRASSAGLPQASSTLAQMDQYIPLDQRQKGIAMAREIERTAMKPPAPTGIAAAELPPSAAGAGYAPPPSAPPARSKPVPKPAAVATRPLAPKPGAAGDWRVQLGAFSDAGRARALWGSLQRSFAGAQPYYVKAGAVTRLQAGPYASRGEAERQCAAMRGRGQACLPVKP